MLFEKKFPISDTMIIREQLKVATKNALYRMSSMYVQY